MQCVGLLWFRSTWGRVWWQPAAGRALIVTSRGACDQAATGSLPVPLCLSHT